MLSVNQVMKGGCSWRSAPRSAHTVCSEGDADGHLPGSDSVRSGYLKSQYLITWIKRRFGDRQAELGGRRSEATLFFGLGRRRRLTCGGGGLALGAVFLAHDRLRRTVVGNDT